MTLRAIGLLILPGLALLLLAAHLVHAGLIPLASVALMLIGLLSVRRPWAARVVQVVLLIGAIEWVLTAVGLAQLRASHGEPYLRLAAILGAVTVFTVLAAAVFRHPALRRYFAAPTVSPATGPTGP
jgi:hypothetical protein